MLDLRHLMEVDDFEKVVPCEVSILEYSLDQGIEKVIHKFINPGNFNQNSPSFYAICVNIY